MLIKESCFGLCKRKGIYVNSNTNSLHNAFYVLIMLQHVSAVIHLVVCLTKGPKPLPKQALHIVRSRPSSFRREYPPLSLRSSSSFLRLLPHFPVTSIPPFFIFPSIICRRRQFLRKMWPIQLAFRLLISYRIFLCSLTLTAGKYEGRRYKGRGEREMIMGKKGW
jgi:hypothetical protein